MQRAIQRAVQIAGGQSALARAVGLTPQAVQRWVKAGRVSHTKVLAVELATGVPRTLLRPDLYPPESIWDQTRADEELFPVVPPF